MKRFLHKVQVVVFLDGDDVRRAPMAAAVFDDIAKRHPILKNWGIRVCSAGTGEHTIDNAPPHPLAVLAMHNLGLNIAKHKASVLSLEMLEEASIVVAMEQKHIDHVAGRFSAYPGYCTKMVVLLPYLSADSEIDSLIGAKGVGDYIKFAEALEEWLCPRLVYMIVYETMRPLLLKGTGLGTGAVQGKVKVVKAGTPPPAFEPGDILVSPSIDEVKRYPVGHIRSAGGIIIDSIFETYKLMQLDNEIIKIPCISGTLTAMQLLEDGREVTMDATTGLVYAEVDARKIPTH